MPQVERWQYQGRAEPLYPIVAAPTVQLEWFAQPPDPVRRAPTTASLAAGAVGGAVPITPSTGWWQEQQTAVRRVLQAAEGAVVEGVPPIVSFSWHVPSTALPVRRIPPASEGVVVEGLVPIIAFDWLVPRMELPVLRAFFLNEGGAVGEFVLFTPELSWQSVLPHDVPRRRVPVAQQQDLAFIGQLTFVFIVSVSGEQLQAGKFLQYQGLAEPVTTPAPAEEVSIDWLQQHPTAPRARRISEGLQVGGFTPIVPFSWDISQPDITRRMFFLQQGGTFFAPSQIVSFSWYAPQSDLVRRKFLMREGGGVSGFTPIAPSFAWYQEPADVTRLRRILLEGGASLGLVPIISSFGWFEQQEDVTRRKRITLEGGTVGGSVPIAPSFAWNISKPDVARRKFFLQQGGSYFVDTPRVAAFDWNIAQPDVTRREFFLLEGGIAFVDTPRPAAFDWFVQAREPLSLSKVIQGGMAEGPLFTPAPVVFFDWFQQPADLFARLRRYEQFVQSLGYLIVPPLNQIAEAYNVILIGGKKIQVQTKAEPLFPIVAAAPAFDWFLQQTDIARRKFFLNAGGSSFVDTPRVASFDWQIQETDLVRRKAFINIGGTTGGFAPIAPSFAWHQEPADVARRKFFLQQGGASSGFVPIVPSFAWFEEGPDPVRQRRIVLEGGETSGFSPIIPSFGWFSKQPDLLSHKVRRAEGGTTGGFSPIVSFSWFTKQLDIIQRKRQVLEGGVPRNLVPITPPTAIFFDWYVAPADIVRAKPRRIEGGTTGEAAPIIPSFGWYNQKTDIAKRRPFIQTGGSVGGFSPIVSFSWDVPQSDLVRREHQVQEGMFTSGEPVEVHIDWIQQPQVPPQRPPRKLISAVTEVLRPPDLFPDSWDPKYPDQPRAAKRRPWLPSEFRIDFEFPPEVLTLDKWFQQQFNPFIKPKRPPSNVVFPIHFFTGISQIIFEIRVCFEMWDFYENALLPTPSNYERIMETIVPSGYVDDLETLPAPSGWTRQSSSTPWNLAR